MQIIELKQNKLISLVNDNNYDSHLKQFNNYLIEQNKEFSKDSLISFWKWLLKQGYSPKTLNVKRQALKSGIKKTFLKEADSYTFISILDNFFKEEIKAFKVDRSIYFSDTLNKEEIDILINKTPEKISLIIQILALTGLRVSEMLSLKLSDSRKREGIYYFRVIGKGRKERTIYIPENLVIKILAEFNTMDFLFVNRNGDPFSRRYIHSEISKYGYRILNKSIHPHTLRHSFATIKHEEGKSIKGISKYLGHSTTSITLDMYVDTPLKPEDVLNV